ncbi:MAG: hypothetical protein WDA11_08230 [Thiohalomonadaceae bacterium]
MREHLTEKQQYWLGHVQACDRAGLTMRSYAEANGLSLAALYSWKATLRRKGALDEAAKPRLFQRATVVGGRASGQCRVVLPSGLALEVTCGTEPTWVAELVRALS